MRRPSSGGVAVSLGEEGARPWSLKVVIGPPQNGVRSVDLRADKVPAANILLAMRVKDLTYSADLLPRQGDGRRRQSHRQRHTRLSDADRFGGDERRMGFRTARIGRTLQDR